MVARLCASAAPFDFATTAAGVTEAGVGAAVVEAAAEFFAEEVIITVVGLLGVRCQ